MNDYICRKEEFNIKKVEEKKKIN